MPDQIIPADVADLLDTLPTAIAEKIKVLSLDCFGTLHWRNGNAPRDVFAAESGRALYRPPALYDDDGHRLSAVGALARLLLLANAKNSCCLAGFSATSI